MNTISLTDLLNKGEYWSAIAQLEPKEITDKLAFYSRDSYRCRPAYPRSKRKPRLDQLDKNPSEVGR